MLTKTLIHHASSWRKLSKLDTSAGSADKRLVVKTSATSRGVAMEVMRVNANVTITNPLTTTIKGTGGQIRLHTQRRISLLISRIEIHLLTTSPPTMLATTFKYYNAIFAINEATMTQWTVQMVICTSRWPTLTTRTTTSRTPKKTKHSWTSGSECVLLLWRTEPAKAWYRTRLVR